MSVEQSKEATPVGVPVTADAVEEDNGVFTGGNPRPRTLVGQAPGERTYDKVRDSTGRLVSKKPANGPFLAHQRWKEQEAERKAREARGEKPLPRAGSNSDWTLWRVLKWVTLILAATMAAGNFLVKSPFWGYGDQMVKTYRNLVTPQKVFTPEQLARYDGSDKSKPVYLGIDGDVYDVTASRRVYGPLGPYHVMAGRDASRAFITGCFQTHLTHDLRGLSEHELGALANWKKFFAKHTKYVKVGTLDRPPIDPNSAIPEPCEPPSSAGGAPDAVPMGNPHAGRNEGAEEQKPTAAATQGRQEL